MSWNHVAHTPTLRRHPEELALLGAPRRATAPNDGEQHLGRLVGAVRALLPIADGPQRKVKPRRELFLRQVELLAQRAYGRHAASAGKLCVGCRRSIRVRKRGLMTLLFSHGIEGAPIAFWRLLRIELKSRDTSFF